MESAEIGLDSSSVIQRALKLAQWASLKLVWKFVNTVEVDIYGLAGSKGAGKNRSILEARWYKTVLDLLLKIDKNNF